LGTSKTLYLRSDHSAKIHIQKSRKKKQVWFLLNPFCNAGCVYWWKWNHFVIQRMWCISGIWILFVIYRMWWNLNPFCNIFCLRYNIYSVYILLQFSKYVVGYFSSRTTVNIKVTRISQPVSPLLRARDED
jgi:hypothetical protein